MKTAESLELETWYFLNTKYRHLVQITKSDDPHLKIKINCFIENNKELFRVTDDERPFQYLLVYCGDSKVLTDAKREVEKRILD